MHFNGYICKLFLVTFIEIIPFLNLFEETDCLCWSAPSSARFLGSKMLFMLYIYKLHIVSKSFQVAGKDKMGICLVKEASYVISAESWVLEPT